MGENVQLGSVSQSVVLRSAYDYNGNRTNLSADIGGTMNSDGTASGGTADFLNTYYYDALGEMTSITQSGQTGGNDVAPKYVHLSYDADSRVSEIDRYATDSAETASPSNLVVTSTNTYDNDAHLTDLSYTAQSSTLAAYHWSYDNDSQVTDAYSFSDASSVTVTTPPYEGWADTHYPYDADGNCIARTNISDGTVTGYEWNNAGELTAVLQFPNWSDYLAGSGSTSETDYSYNAAGQMVTMSPNSGPSQHYVYDGQNLALVLNSSGQVVERDLYGPAVNQILATETVTPSSAPQAAGTVNWLLTDNQGTVRDVAQFNSGTTTVVDHLVFDSSGQLTSQSNSAYQPRITYQGMWLDPASDLYYDKARWYNAVDSVFMSPDPLGFGGGQTNLSEFVRNSPTNHTDPSGLQAIGGVTDGLPPGGAADGFQRAVGVLSNASGGGDTPVYGDGTVGQLNPTPDKIPPLPPGAVPGTPTPGHPTPPWWETWPPFNQLPWPNTRPPNWPAPPKPGPKVPHLAPQPPSAPTMVVSSMAPMAIPRRLDSGGWI